MFGLTIALHVFHALLIGESYPKLSEQSRGKRVKWYFFKVRCRDQFLDWLIFLALRKSSSQLPTLLAQTTDIARIRWAGHAGLCQTAQSKVQSGLRASLRGGW